MNGLVHHFKETELYAERAWELLKNLKQANESCLSEKPMFGVTDTLHPSIQGIIVDCLVCVQC